MVVVVFAFLVGELPFSGRCEMGGELATLQTTICVLHAGMNALYCPNDGNSAILSLMRYIGRVTCAISAMMSQPTCMRSKHAAYAGLMHPLY